MGFSIDMFFAGIWPMVWHWGIGIGLIILILLAEVFTSVIPVLGPLLMPFRRDMLWAAGAIAVFLFAQGIGIKDEAARCIARQVKIENRIDSVVKETTTPRALIKPDPYDDPRLQ